MKLRNPLILQQLTLPRGVSFVFNPTMGSKNDPGIENLKTDLLVLTQTSGSKMSEGMQRLDSSLGRALSKALMQNDFHGHTGESVLIDSGKLGGQQNYILVIGLGSYAEFNGRTVCAFMRKVLEVSKELGVEKITIPVFPNRQTEGQINLAGTAATLVCRVRMFADELPKLKEVELFCTPQARRHLQDGLFCRTPRCMVCVNPELGK